MDAVARDSAKKSGKEDGPQVGISRRKVLVGVGAGAVSIAGAALTGKSAAAASVIKSGVGRVAADPGDKHEQKDMKLVGFNDLQNRSTYQPVVHRYPGDRYILFAGHHALGNDPVTGARLPSFNPLTGVNELNGTSIVDVTDPKKPKYLFHLPVDNGADGGAQMNRVNDGSAALGTPGKVYLLRAYANSAHEVWDVTDASHPTGVRTVPGGNPVVAGLTGTHKNWWEPETGIAYLVGRRATDTAAGWRAGNHIMIFNMSNPASPVFIRDWALDGQQPGGVIPPHFSTVPAIHGPISTGPAGNRVYFAYGVGSNGVMQIVDRSLLLSTSPIDYKTAELGRLIMNPDNGAHTSWPLGKMTVPDFVTDTGNDTPSRTMRDIVVVVSEAGGAFGDEFRHLTFMVDVTNEGRPQSISTFEVLSSAGGKDGNNFIDRGGRFGPHATNEEFGPPFYKKVVFVSYFNAGVRAIDVRDPYNPTEVASFVPKTTRATDLRCGTLRGVPNVCRQVIQTNNVATDDRGFVYIVDRADTGLHILELEGEAKKIIG